MEEVSLKKFIRSPPEQMRGNVNSKYLLEMEKNMKMKKRLTRGLSFILAVIMLSLIIPTNMTVANAATSTASLTSLGRKGSISIGSKKKTGTWWQMKLNGKNAFCVNLGYTCHSGNTYEAEETHHWDQDTGGAKNGYYAKIIRWYVIDKKCCGQAFL